MGNIKIGLEIHMHLKTKEKLFCQCSTPTPDSKPNRHICPICTGQPGTKPMLTNSRAIDNVLKLAIVFGSKITYKTNFQRKHYTWPDMPTGFQRTVSGEGVTPNGEGGIFEDIEIEEIHLEENPAAWDPTTGEVNYNRSGMALAEIVTRPNFDSTEKLRKWLEELILVGSYLGVLDEGFGIKSDVNVSIEESGYERVEIKNVNSLTNIVDAAEAEIKRQKELVEKGEGIKRETRRYNDNKGVTEFMRSKETVQDYRFIPEPDLPSLDIDDETIELLKSSIPELPKEKREKYKNYGLAEEDVEVLVSHLYMTELFEKAIDNNLNPREVGLFLRREIMRILNYHGITFQDFVDKNLDDQLMKLLELLSNETVSYNNAQEILEKLYEEKFDVEKYVKDHGLEQVKDTEKIEKIVRKALTEAPKAVEDYKNGNTKSLNFIIGIVMRETKGTAEPKTVNEILTNIVNNEF